MSEEAVYTRRDIVIPAGTLVAKMAMFLDFGKDAPAAEFAMVDIGRYEFAVENGLIGPLSEAIAA